MLTFQWLLFRKRLCYLDRKALLKKVREVFQIDI
jgi:hypothetical protein